MVIFPFRPDSGSKSVRPLLCGTALFFALANPVSTSAQTGCDGDWAVPDRAAYEALLRNNSANPSDGLPGILCTEGPVRRLDALNLREENLSGTLNLHGLEALYSVDVGGNSLRGLDMDSLPVLESLGAGRNELEAVRLASLPGLRDISLEGNWLENLNGFGELPALTWLNLEGNEIEDLAALHEAPALEHLNLNGNNVEDLTPLASLGSLKKLELHDNRITEISSLAGLTGLTYVNLASNHVNDVASLGKLTRLEYLNLAQNRISDVSALSGLTALRHLSLSGNGLESVAALAGLTELGSLNLDNNRVSDLAPLAGMTGLAELYLDGNDIRDIGPLSGLRDMMRLHLRENRIEDATPLGGMKNLIALDLAQNRLTSVDGISPVSDLEILDVSGNRMPLSELYKAAGLSRQFHICNLDDQQNVYFMTRLLYLPVSSVVEIPAGDAFITGVPSRGRVLAETGSPEDGATYSPSSGEGRPGILSISAPGSYRLIMSHPAVINTGMEAVIYEREDGDSLAFSTTGLIRAVGHAEAASLSEEALSRLRADGYLDIGSGQLENK